MLRLKILVLVLSAILFLGSLGFSVFDMREGNPTFIMGFVCLLFGWAYPAWYANPLILAAHVLLLRSKYLAAMILATAAVGLGATTLLIEEVPRDSSGETTEVLGYLAGFHLWMASLAVPWVAAICLWWQRRGKPPV